MYWSAIQPENRFVSRPDFDGFDHEVKLAAEHGIRVFPFLLHTPDWVAPDPRTLPVATPWERWAWSAFLRDAAERYGVGGSFWKDNPDVPYFPIRSWEIWNEENIVTFTQPISPTGYAKLLRLSGRVLHAVDPGSKVIVGGLFGRPLAGPAEHAVGGLPLRPLPLPARSSSTSTAWRCTPTSPTPARSAARSTTCAASCASTTTPAPTST